MKLNSHKKILLTGASGKLGGAILNSGLFPGLLSPGSNILDITKPVLIERYFKEHDFGSVIHCAAFARMAECEKNPPKAMETNIIGTANLVKVVIKKENKINTSIRFIHISTDGVYAGIKSEYSEKDPAIPYNKYGWTKLGAECSVNMLSNFCIIRTSFFEPKRLAYKYSATDLYSSKLPVDYLVRAILFMLDSDFIGTINIGSKRESDYERYRRFNILLKPCKAIDIVGKLNFAIAKDASLDCNLWQKIAKGKLKK